MTDGRPDREALPADIAALLEGESDEPVSEAVRHRVREKLESTLSAGPAPGLGEGVALTGTGASGALVALSVVFAIGALVRPGQGPPAIEVVPGVTLVESKEAPTARGVRLAATPMKAAPKSPVATSPLMQARPQAASTAPPRVLPQAEQRVEPHPNAPPPALAPEGSSPSVAELATTKAPQKRRPQRDLEKERALLDKARAALRSNNAGRALSLVLKHRGRFPRGALSEERESLGVRALVESGQHASAKKRGARFLKRYPRSIHRAAVERALKRADK